MGSTTLYGLRYPEYGQGADVKLDLQKLAEDVAPRLHRAEPLTGAQITAIASPRIGQLVTNTDTGRVLFWNGTAWRPVGGLATGTINFSGVSIGTSFATVAYFIGLGFEEAQFTLSVPAGGGFQAVATTDATRAQGVGTNPGTSSPVQMFSPSATSDTMMAGVTATSSVSTIINLRNIRLDADGYLRFELSSGGAFVTGAGHRINWKAR